MDCSAASSAVGSRVFAPFIMHQVYMAHTYINDVWYTRLCIMNICLHVQTFMQVPMFVMYDV